MGYFNSLLMKRMHKPDPRLAADAQDKRSVIPIERDDMEQWLFGTRDEATRLLKLADATIFRAGPISSPRPPALQHPPAADDGQLSLL